MPVTNRPGDTAVESAAPDLAGLCASGTTGLSRADRPRYLGAIPYRDLC